MVRAVLRVVVVALTASFPFASCGSDVDAFECSADSKGCPIDGRPTCVARDDPKYGCASPTTCLSCLALGFEHASVMTCDVFRGVCIVIDCDMGFKHCEGPESAGCETSVNLSTKHCGGCNRPCPTTVANGTPICISGVCTASCNAGFFDCDKRIDNGCECPNGCSGLACAP